MKIYDFPSAEKIRQREEEEFFLRHPKRDSLTYLSGREAIEIYNALQIQEMQRFIEIKNTNAGRDVSRFAEVLWAKKYALRLSGLWKSRHKRVEGMPLDEQITQDIEKKLRALTKGSDVY